MGDDNPVLAMSVKEAARVSGIGRSKVYIAIADGSLKAHHHGRRTIILREDLIVWLRTLDRWAPVAVRLGYIKPTTPKDGAQ